MYTIYICIHTHTHTHTHTHIHIYYCLNEDCGFCMNGPGEGKERRGKARKGLLEDNTAWGAMGNLHNLE